MKDGEGGETVFFDDFCPHAPRSPRTSCDGVEGGGARAVGDDWGGRGGGGEEKKHGANSCGSSCVLAVGGGRVIGIGQVRVGLPVGYAVQLRLHVAQAQL